MALLTPLDAEADCASVVDQRVASEVVALGRWLKHPEQKYPECYAQDDPQSSPSHRRSLAHRIHGCKAAI